MPREPRRNPRFWSTVTSCRTEFRRMAFPLRPHGSPSFRVLCERVGLSTSSYSVSMARRTSIILDSLI
jgi:hypothetical protein